MIPESTISNFIESQFPDIYKEEGSDFIAFVEAYMQWMELPGNPIHESRQIPVYKDIDTTPDQFILFFKEKYLKNIQFDTSSNKRLAIKNSLDLYRSKGTERSVDLFFKLIYGISAEVYYPGDDIFTLSSGTWEYPKYLEVTSSPYIVDYVGKQITGVFSGSTAFVEKFIKRKTNLGYVNLLYLSNIVGNFERNEALFPITININPPKVIGSLNSVQVLSGGDGFSIGDIVDVISSTGVNGKARVSETSVASGEVDFLFVSGGSGYTANSVVLVANNTLTISNIVTSQNNYFQEFSTIIQPSTNVSFGSATATFTVNTNIYSTANGIGKILSVSQISNTGSLSISVLSGTFSANNKMYTDSNTVIANVISATDTSITAKVLQLYPTITIQTTTSQTIVNPLDIAYQQTSGIITAQGTVLSSNDRVFVLENVTGYFITSRPITIGSSYTSNVASISAQVDIANVSGTLQTAFNPYMTAIGLTSVLTGASGGNNASFLLSSVSNTETVTINTDLLSNYLSVRLNANNYGLPANTANLSTIIGTTLTNNTFSIGTISGINSVNPGADYVQAPTVVIVQPFISAFRKSDYRLSINITSGIYSVGEIVQQNYTANSVPYTIQGKVKHANSSVLLVKRLQFNQPFISNTTLSGLSSNASSTVTHVDEDSNEPNYMGMNANIGTDVNNSNGSIQTIEIVDSGYGYLENQVIFKSASATKTATGQPLLSSFGTGSGYYKTTKGFLSSNKYLYDGDFYQEYSYEVISKLPFDKYSDMLKKVIHVAGTKLFGSVSIESTISSYETSTISSIVQG